MAAKKQAKKQVRGKTTSTKLEEEMIKYYRRQNQKPKKTKRVSNYVWMILAIAAILIFIFSNSIVSLFTLLTAYFSQIFLVSMIAIVATEVIVVIQLFKSGNKEEFNKDMTILLAVIQIVLVFFQAMLISNQNIIQAQQKDLLNQTSSPKYANIDTTLSQYVGNTAYFSLNDIKNKEEQNISPKIGLNIINTGQLNTGEVQLSQRYSDNNLQFETLSVGNISSQSNQAFWINFTIINYSGLPGAHHINLTIFCPNCFEQGIQGLMTKEVVICIYNDTTISSDEASKDCN